jgi:hypothetical protein
MHSEMQLELTDHIAFLDESMVTVSPADFTEDQRTRTGGKRS